MSGLGLVAAAGILASLAGCATGPDGPSLRLRLDDHAVTAPPGGPAMIGFAVHNGSWKIKANMWNTDPPAPTPK